MTTCPACWESPAVAVCGRCGAALPATTVAQAVHAADELRAATAEMNRARWQLMVVSVAAAGALVVLTGLLSWLWWGVLR